MVIPVYKLVCNQGFFARMFLSPQPSGSSEPKKSEPENKRQKRSDGSDDGDQSSSSAVAPDRPIGAQRFTKFSFSRTFRFYVYNQFPKGLYTGTTVTKKPHFYVKLGHAYDGANKATLAGYRKIEFGTEIEEVNAETWKWDDAWYILPYDMVCASLTMRQFQGINTIGRRWRFTSVGFHINNIVPLNDEIKSVGGVVSQITSPNVTPHMETFMDLDHDLPPSVGKGCANVSRQWSMNCGAAQASELPRLYDVPLPDVYAAYNNLFNLDDVNRHQVLQLMNSKNFSTVTPNDTWSHTFNVKGQWRHGHVPFGVNSDKAKDVRLSNYYNQVWGHLPNEAYYDPFVTTVLSGDKSFMANKSFSLWTPSSSPHPPTCLIRPAPISKKIGTNEESLSFTFLCTFTSEVEVDLVQVCGLPVFNRIGEDANYLLETGQMTIPRYEAKGHIAGGNMIGVGPMYREDNRELYQIV